MCAYFNRRIRCFISKNNLMNWELFEKWLITNRYSLSLFISVSVTTEPILRIFTLVENYILQ